MPFVDNYFRWGMFLTWFGLALLTSRKFLGLFVIQCWPLLIFLFYMIMIANFVQRAELIVNIKSISYLLIVYTIFLYYFESKYKLFQKALVVFLFLDIMVVGINTHLQLKINPLIARYLATEAEKREMLLGTDMFYGVGGYGYFYMLGSIILLIAYLLFNFQKNKFVNFLIIIAFISLLIEASYTIAILFTFVFLSIIILLRYTNRKTMTVIIFLGVVTLPISKGIIGSMFEGLSNINDISPEVSTRLFELSHFFLGNDISGTDMDGRNYLYIQSIDAFMNNIWTGTLLSYDEQRVGGHSAWLDLLGTFGVFSMLFFAFLFKSYKFFKNKVQSKYKSIFNIYWSYFVLLGFVNPLLFSNIFTIWFLFLPFCIISFFHLSEDKT